MKCALCGNDILGEIHYSKTGSPGRPICGPCAESMDEKTFTDAWDGVRMTIGEKDVTFTKYTRSIPKECEMTVSIDALRQFVVFMDHRRPGWRDEQ